jgi:galactonate dehydratase
MKIKRLETFLTNAGLRNYLFVRLVTDTGLTGIGEASLEWQERAVEVLLNEWVAARVVGRDPFDIEDVVGGMVRDQYQGGATVMTAISGAEIAMWDLIGKACGQPVYRLIGGRAHETVYAYANGWYGGCRMPAEFAARAEAVVARGYDALKFDPFTTAWKTLDGEEEHAAIEIIDAVARAVGPKVGLMIEIHGRLAAGEAIRFIRRLASHNIVWCEEPVAPENLDLLNTTVASSIGVLIGSDCSLTHRLKQASSFRSESCLTIACCKKSGRLYRLSPGLSCMEGQPISPLFLRAEMEFGSRTPFEAGS